MTEAFAGKSHAGERLDRTLLLHLPDMSLRAVRRLIARGQVLVNGGQSPAGYRLRALDTVVLNVERNDRPVRPQLLAQQGDFFFFFKERGLHTAAIVGNLEPCLEASVDAYFPGLTLLQRLDRGTAGFVLAGANEKACNAYRVAEKSDKCIKSYLALLSGYLAKSRWVKNRLICNGGKKVRILKEDAPQVLWTYFEPLAHSKDATLALCRLGRGQRHQVRAHAAAMDNALVGDALYGNASVDSFLLEHCALSFPGHNFCYLDKGSPLLQLFPLECEQWLKHQDLLCI